MSYLLPLKIKTISVVKERTTEPSGGWSFSLIDITPCENDDISRNWEQKGSLVFCFYLIGNFLELWYLANKCDA